MTSTKSSSQGEKTVQSSDGTDIFVKEFVAESPKAQILVSHGYLEHGLCYQEFAEYLVGEGISVIVYDCRGHGRSGGARGFLNDWEKYGADFEAVRSTLLLTGEAPVFILGHSNGGLIVLDHHLRAASNGSFPKDVKGIILSSPFIEPATELPRIKKLLGQVFGKVLPSLTIPADLKEADLTSDPKKQRQHHDDPLILKDATTGWALQCMKAQKRARKMVETTTLPVPVLLFYGSADPVASPKVNEEVGENLKAEDKTVLRREGEMHETLNEIKREELFENIIEWVLKRA